MLEEAIAGRWGNSCVSYQGCADRWVIGRVLLHKHGETIVVIFPSNEMSEKLMNWINWCVFLKHFYIHGYCRRLEGKGYPRITCQAVTWPLSVRLE